MRSYYHKPPLKAKVQHQTECSSIFGLDLSLHKFGVMLNLCHSIGRDRANSSTEGLLVGYSSRPLSREGIIPKLVEQEATVLSFRQIPVTSAGNNKGKELITLHI